MKEYNLSTVLANIVTSMLLLVVSCSIFTSFKMDTRLLIIPIVWIILVILLTFIIKSIFHAWLVSVANAMVAGLTMSICFHAVGGYQPINLWTGLLILSLIVGNFLFYSQYTFTRKNSLVFSLLWLVAVACGALFWHNTTWFAGSWLAFLGTIGFAFNLAAFFLTGKKHELNNINLIKYSSLFVFGSVLLLAITMITEGDTLELFGEWEPSSQQKKA